MGLSRTDLVPVLAIMVGGTLGALASGLFLMARSDDVPPDALVVRAATVQATAFPPLVYIEGVRVGHLPETLPLEAWLRGEHEFPAPAVRSALEKWLEMTDTSPMEIDGVEGIEVVRGQAAVARYGDDASGGVVLVSLKRAPGASGQATAWGVSPAWTEASYTVAPRIQNIGEVRRAMFAAYPALLRDAGVGGTVRVYFFIDEQGEVQDTRIDQSSGHAAIDEAALGVADVFRFSAALNGDEPVPARVSHSLTFEVR